MLGSLLGSLALGLVKGFTSKTTHEFSAQTDIYAPIREELAYRGSLRAAPTAFGSTAVTFVVDHVLSEAYRQPNMTASQMAARFGDVLLGGTLYEGAMRSHGILGAIASHALHNTAVSVGSRLRWKKK